MRTLHDFIEYDNENRRKARASLSARVSDIPVTEEVLEQLVWLNHDDLDIVLECHPGDNLEKKWASVWMMLSLFKQAHSDLLFQLDRFHTFSEQRDFRTRTNELELENIETAVRKELMAVSFSASALEALSRNATSAAPIVDYLDKLRSSFDRKEHEFVTELRNALAHINVPEAGWHITWDQEKNRETDFTLGSWQLLTYTKLNIYARDYVLQSGKNVPIRPLIASYSKRVYDFYEWLRQQHEKSPPAALADYKRCRNACRTNTNRVWYKIFLQQFIAKRVDPYKHLSKYLLPEQLGAALAIPHKSQEQIDFIISAVNTDDAIDNEVRQLIYKLFELAP